jgi:hypothetical protein
LQIKTAFTGQTKSGDWVKTDLVIEECNMESLFLEYDIKEPPEKFKLSHLHQLMSLTGRKLLIADLYLNYGVGEKEAVQKDIAAMNAKIEAVVVKMREFVEKQ